MTAPTTVPVFCPGCHLADWLVTRDPKSGQVAVICEACGHVLLTAQSEPTP